MPPLLLHPHPDTGGNQHNNVVSAIFGALDGAVRFDFASSDLEVATGQVLIAPALETVSPVIGADARRKHLLAAERDGFFAPAAMRDAGAGWTATTHDVVAGADHFFVGHEVDAARPGSPAGSTEIDQRMASARSTHASSRARDASLRNAVAVRGSSPAS